MLIFLNYFELYLEVYDFPSFILATLTKYFPGLVCVSAMLVNRRSSPHAAIQFFQNNKMVMLQAAVGLLGTFLAVSLISFTAKHFDL